MCNGRAAVRGVHAIGVQRVEPKWDDEGIGSKWSETGDDVAVGMRRKSMSGNVRMVPSGPLPGALHQQFDGQEVDRIGHQLPGRKPTSSAVARALTKRTRRHSSTPTPTPTRWATCTSARPVAPMTRYQA